MHRVTLQPSGEQFDVADDQTILRAGLDAGIALPRSCRNGTCRACRARVVQGEVRHTIEWPGLSREEKIEGWILPCVATPLTDLVLSAKTIGGPEP
jgi:ferredoxin